mmetsp:Transcript_1013/g.1797  ORF Transcript_1013/g.1797 Transcript_1013/m.1797 type:complete len:92 (+) Transcript_1013:720-995(+)
MEGSGSGSGGGAHISAARQQYLDYVRVTALGSEVKWASTLFVDHQRISLFLQQDQTHFWISPPRGQMQWSKANAIAEVYIRAGFDELPCGL